ncbi:MAG: hypothetical protein JOY58_18685, partial [Solirubrobacterales bacterium]|nr:hypothetical protein [Solirubrobacterales bacterium]
VNELNAWLLNALTEENRSALAEANKIIDERNAWFNGEPGSPTAAESPG